MKVLSVVDRFEPIDPQDQKILDAVCRFKSEALDAESEIDKNKVRLDYEKSVGSMIEEGFDIFVSVCCCKCGESIDVTKEDLNLIDPSEFYCGASERCMP